MAKYFLCLILQRLLLPILIATCFLRRPVGISIPYFLLFLYLPLVPVATSKSMKGQTGVFLKLLIVSTVLISLCQVAFQIALVSLESDFLPKCGSLEIILRHVGLIKLLDLPVLNIIDWISPEILMLVTSLGIFFALRSLSMQRVHDIENDGETLLEAQASVQNQSLWTDDKHKFFSGLGVFLSMFSILVAASLRPSIEGGVYFLIYIAAGTYWACHRSLGRGFGFVLRIFMVFIIFHMAAVLSYQTPIMQEMFNFNGTIARYFGLNDIYQSTCSNGSDIRDVHLNTTLDIDSYLNPIGILVCYYILGFTSSLLLTKLMRRGTRRLRGSQIDETASGEMQMSTMELKDKEVPSTEGTQESNFVDQLVLGIETVASIIYKNSYIFTNICMMAWSIMYHSWLTFVFLIWANVLWIIPNQRKAMLRSSPFIVLYAIVLLFAQYIYSMNLLDSELPTKFDNDKINLVQIGFERYAHYPIQHIVIKSAFTVMFWITLRQLIQENKLVKQKSTIADMVAPLNVTVGTAAGRMAGSKPEKSEFMKRMGEFLNSLLLKTWIWIVMLTVFTSGMAGTKMTGFRIIYMALFLVFILVFQISWRIWKLFMYGFWLILIAYAMLILILVYTYQFDRFPEYWSSYLGIPMTLQKDIGLDQFETKELFLHLLTPTLVVIITVIQLHYFHHKYVEMLQLPLRNDSIISAPTRNSSNFGVAQNNDGIPSDNSYTNQEHHRKKSFGHVFQFKKWTKAEFKEHLIEFGKNLLEFTEIVWIFLELHLIKLILFVAFLLGIYEVSLLHICFVLISVIGTSFRSKFQILISRVISFIVAVLFITKMIYQVDYIDHKAYDVVCNNVTNPNKINNADWFGLQDAEFGLMNLLKSYIYYLVIVTLHSVVRFRQHHKRASHNEPYATPSIMFPKINRTNSEKNLSHMIKYLLNYGFYKFGIEICLIVLVALIGSRLDLIACIYTIWLVIIFSLNRENASRIWFIFVLFIMASTIIQYIIIVGLPPGLCIEYPWDTEFLQKLQKWAMLPDAKLYTQVKKLVLDFILLLVVTRQAVVFRIERRYKDNIHAFPGGSNVDITSEITRQGFSLLENPTPDFTTHVRNWLDIMKRVLLPTLFWFSLAIVFLTGANRVNLFSIGYLVSSFIFLWQGSDLYLRPINTIIRWWRVMLSYNIFVIIFKTFLQIAGCLFFDDIAKYACWIIQLLGITCISKFEIKVINENCVVPDEEVGLFWDGVCFACLLFQLRTFRSYYFCHIVNDTKASNILASRGAQLIEEFQAKQLRLQGEHENEILDKIKMKMDRIKASQQKMKVMREPKIHAEAIRSGDYYMFEEMDNKVELDILEDRIEEDVVEDATAERLKHKLTLIAIKLQEMNDADLKQEAIRIKNLKRRASQQPTSHKVVDARTTVSEPIIMRDSPPSSSQQATEITTDDQQPSTSRGGATSAPKMERQDSKTTIASIEDTPIDKDDEKQKPLQGLLFIWTFIESILVSLTIRFNRVSRNYRYVMKVLSKEKKTLKSSEGFGMGLKISSALIWGQAPASDQTATEQVDTAATSTISSGSITLEVVDSPKKSSGENDRTSKDFSDKGFQQRPVVHETPEIEDHEDKFKESEDFSRKEHSVIVELIASIWFAILSHTDFLCFFMVLLNQVQSASILSLPLPLMVFFWGTLTVPRPSKTFWITLIAYTQTVVLLKCVSQFEILWWNEHPIPENQPLAPARIFGIEKKKGYATYDLALLLVVFFHRFMLKSMGLWKSELRDEVLKDGIYKVKEIEANDDDENGAVVQFNDENVVNVIKSNNKQIELTKVGSNAELEFVDEKGDIDKVQVSNLIEETGNYFPEIVKLASSKYTSSIRLFFVTLLGPASRATRDVYVYMILCDFINFLVLLFGFTSFGASQGDGGVTAYLQENKIPVAFLVMLILQFVLIVIDRALYLRKYLLGKIIFQYILIVAIHIWMFFVLPGVTERSFNMRLAPVIWYLIKCIYLLFSAYQIRCGYPKRSLGNFLTKGFGVINFVSHKVFLLIPFLFELRTLMDWIWTDTTMTLFDWLKMEDIFVSVYQIKCTRQLETDFPKPRGLKTPTLIKYLMGGGLLFVLIAIIWFPLALFAFGNTVGETNPPYDVTVSLRIGPYEPVYTMSAQDSNIIPFSENIYGQMLRHYARDRVAITFLSNFDPGDITAVLLSSNSTSLWNISPPDKNRLREDIESNHTLTVRFKYAVSRNINSEKEKTETITDDRTFELGIGDPKRQLLSDMLSGKPDDELLIMPYLYPKFLKVKNQGVLKPTARLLGHDYYEDDDNAFRNISIRLFHSDLKDVQSSMWWEVKELCNDTIYLNNSENFPFDNCEQNVVMYLFNDKIFPSQLSSLAANGIVGLYLSLVIVVSRVIRGFFSLMYTKIMFEDLPYIDRVLQLCLDIYLVREALEFPLEEDLFAKLIFLYRSPETMIKWTRPKEEEGDDDEEGGGSPSPPPDRRLTDTDYTVRQRKPMEEKAE